jgi:hypothetical protein
MKTQAPEAPRGSTAGDNEVAVSMTARLGGALLLLALVAGILISTLLYPPAAVGAVIASIALAACLVRMASEGADQ